MDAAAETLERTTVGDWRAGTRINLERSLKIGDELGGHIVTGHVDGLATIVAREAITAGDDPWGPTARFDIKAPAAARPFIAEKGSVCLDGTSLTVNTVDGRRVLGADHSAHARGHHLGRAAGGRQAQSRGRSHGPLRGAACGGTPARGREAGLSLHSPHPRRGRMPERVSWPYPRDAAAVQGAGTHPSLDPTPARSPQDEGASSPQPRIG